MSSACMEEVSAPVSMRASRMMLPGSTRAHSLSPIIAYLESGSTCSHTTGGVGSHSLVTGSAIFGSGHCCTSQTGQGTASATGQVGVTGGVVWQPSRISEQAMSSEYLTRLIVRRIHLLFGTPV